MRERGRDHVVLPYYYALLCLDVCEALAFCAHVPSHPRCVTVALLRRFSNPAWPWEQGERRRRCCLGQINWQNHTQKHTEFQLESAPTPHPHTHTLTRWETSSQSSTRISSQSSRRTRGVGGGSGSGRDSGSG